MQSHISRILSNIAQELFEFLILCDEISLCIHLDKSHSIFSFSGSDESFICLAPFLFYSRGHTRFAKDLDRFFHISTGLIQCLFAFSHTHAGAFSQFFDQIRSDFLAHIFSSPSPSSDSPPCSVPSFSPLMPRILSSFLRSMIACVKDWRINLMLFR